MPEWVSVHAFCFHDQDSLIVNVIGPLVDRLLHNGRIGEYFFLRYWEGGPHVRLRMLADEDVRRSAVDHLAGYLREWAESVLPREYADMASRLARAEGRDDYDRRHRRDLTVECIPYRPECDVFGGEEGVRTAERHFTTSSHLALDVLRSGVAMEQRAAFALAALMLTLAVCERDPRRAADWFPPRHASDEFEVRYQRQRNALRKQIHTLWRAEVPVSPEIDTPGVSSTDGHTVTWLKSIQTLHDELIALRLPGQQVREILLRCAHLLHNRLGLDLTCEAYLRYLTACALTDLAQKV